MIWATPTVLTRKNVVAGDGPELAHIGAADDQLVEKDVDQSAPSSLEAPERNIEDDLVQFLKFGEDAASKTGSRRHHDRGPRTALNKRCQRDGKPQRDGAGLVLLRVTHQVQLHASGEDPKD